MMVTKSVIFLAKGVVLIIYIYKSGSVFYSATHDPSSLRPGSDPYPNRTTTRPTFFSTRFHRIHWSLLDVFSPPFLYFHPSTLCIFRRPSQWPLRYSANTPTSPTRTRCAITVSLSLPSLATLLQRLFNPKPLCTGVHIIFCWEFLVYEQSEVMVNAYVVRSEYRWK